MPLTPLALSPEACVALVVASLCTSCKGASQQCVTTAPPHHKVIVWLQFLARARLYSLRPASSRWCIAPGPLLANFRTAGAGEGLHGRDVAPNTSHTKLDQFDDNKTSLRALQNAASSALTRYKRVVFQKSSACCPRAPEFAAGTEKHPDATCRGTLNRIQRQAAFKHV